MMWRGTRDGRGPGLRDASRASGARAKLLFVAAAGAALVASCTGEGGGKDPPGDRLYYPTGLAVSPGGRALYVVNSNFDLQFNGGTLQSFDLKRVRRDTVRLINNPGPECAAGLPPAPGPDGKRPPLGQACAPPTPLEAYRQGTDTAVIGAFASDLVRSTRSGLLVSAGSAEGAPTVTSRNVHRLYALVRGDTSLTYADVESDLGADGATLFDTDPFTLDCGARDRNRCAKDHQAGRDVTEPGNTRDVTLPGDPYALAESQDGSLLVVSHQTEARASLFFSGLVTRPADPQAGTPEVRTFERAALKDVLADLPLGSTGVALVPQDPRAVPACGGAAPCPPSAGRAPTPAFYIANRASQNVNLVQLTLLRAYPDTGSSNAGAEGGAEVTPELSRPFLVRESTAGFSINAGGGDSRGMVIDPSPRILCEKRLRFENERLPTPKTDAELAPELSLCARRPARVYIANRSPASLLVGEVGDAALGSDGTYSPTRINLQATIPLAAGPSRLYVAPVVDAGGLYALRVFIVCFESRTIFVYDPERNALENIIRTAEGPHALAFDPFELEDVLDKRVRGIQVPMPMLGEQPTPEDEDAVLGLRRYRFAYLASFTRSFIQVIDLDNSREDKSTFETVVFSLGVPTAPIGTR